MLSATSCFLLSLEGAAATKESEHPAVGDATIIELKSTAQNTKDAAPSSDWQTILNQSLPKQHATRGDNGPNPPGAESDNKESMQPKDDDKKTVITESAITAGSGGRGLVILPEIVPGIVKEIAQVLCKLLESQMTVRPKWSTYKELSRNRLSFRIVAEPRR